MCAGSQHVIFQYELNMLLPGKSENGKYALTGVLVFAYKLGVPCYLSVHRIFFFFFIILPPTPPPAYVYVRIVRPQRLRWVVFTSCVVEVTDCLWWIPPLPVQGHSWWQQALHMAERELCTHTAEQLGLGGLSSHGSSNFLSLLIVGGQGFSTASLK